MHEIEKQLNRIENKLNYLIKEMKMADVTNDQLVAEASNETTLQASVITLLNTVQAQLTAALANTAIPADVQAKMNTIFSTLTSNDAAVTAALTANTPVIAAQATATP